ncbi:HNH endonuclease [Paenibacillus sp. EKM206P]|uniref:HNH endonuclease signature motif containing protein n=1 Tax=Paenibacillus sp. EKM206P TaxID=1683674 RepID=UPI0013EA23D8|nr:HNH endonuclease signature motif containing protein [Paenibacillus sp. EKM206P]KAF6569066.1 HNH endonuclease [Paenibacillus sp. EKM206P]
MVHRYTPEQREFIKNNATGIGNAELTDLFNTHFGLNLPVEKIKRFKANHGISSGLTGRFETGHVPANKGKKGLCQGGVETQFKKGHKPHNYVPVGSERVNGDDYVDIKIADPNKWRGKHLIVWEQHHGQSVPNGHAVIFGDGNRRNFDLDNLILVSRGQLAIMNKNGLIQSNAELTRTGIIMADIFKKIGERKRRKR